MAPVVLRFVAPAFLSLVLSGCGGGCDYDATKMAAEGKTITDKMTTCTTSAGSDTAAAKKCNCDAQASLIKLYEDIGDKCDDLAAATKTSVDAAKAAQKSAGCAAMLAV